MISIFCTKSGILKLKNRVKFYLFIRVFGVWRQMGKLGPKTLTHQKHKLTFPGFIVAECKQKFVFGQACIKSYISFQPSYRCLYQISTKLQMESKLLTWIFPVLTHVTCWWIRSSAAVIFWYDVPWCCSGWGGILIAATEIPDT